MSSVWWPTPFGPPGCNCHPVPRQPAADTKSRLNQRRSALPFVNADHAGSRPHLTSPTRCAYLSDAVSTVVTASRQSVIKGWAMLAMASSEASRSCDWTVPTNKEQ